MTEQFNDWLDSGRFVYCAITAAAWQADQVALTTWPFPRFFGDYALLNVEKSKAPELFEYLNSLGFAPIYEFIEDSGQPMLLTHEQAKTVLEPYEQEGA